jgi:hypothetical protein
MNHVKGFFAATAALSLIVAGRPAVAADDLKHDVKDERNAAVFNQFLEYTSSCMNSRARAMLLQGVRDSAEIINFVQKSCDGPLSNFMQNTLKRPSKEVGAFVLALAHEELKIIPELTRSINPRTIVKKLDWGKPAALNGTFGIGTFNSCCVAGKESKQTYFFIRLENKVDVISDVNDETEPTMQNVDTIELGVKAADVRALKVGQEIAVSCKALWFGNTGGYALPVYCTDAKKVEAAERKEGRHLNVKKGL